VINDALGSPDNSDAILVQIYELQGTAYLFLGREDKARYSFERLLQAEPDYQLPKTTSNKIRALFEQVRAERKPVKLTHTPLATARPGERLDVRAQVADLPAGAKTRLYYRRAGTEAYSSTSFSAEGADYVARIPAFELPAEDSEYALEYIPGDRRRRRAAAWRGRATRSRRCASASRRGRSPPPAGRPGGRRGRGLVPEVVGVDPRGAVAVGAGVGVGVALTQPKDATLPITVTVVQQ
jgi:hypothetical protein